MPSLVWTLATVAAVISPAVGAIYEQACDLPKQTYDYVIVGSGIGGSVLANRLSENPNTKVLLLESGADELGSLNMQIPLLSLNDHPDDPFEWNYTTTAQTELNNRVLAYPRARLLGGTSNIHYNIWNRGSQDYWDNVAKLTGRTEWSWKSMQTYFAKAENWTSPMDGHNTTGEFLPQVHYTSGMVPVTVGQWPEQIDSRIIETTKLYPNDFPFQPDMNSGDTIGFGWVQASVGGGWRNSAGHIYLAPKFAARKNLDILVNAHATRVIKTGVKNGVPVFGTVEYASLANSTKFQVHANKEIILSAGAIASPQILLLSGIGDKKALAKFGIPSVLDLPSVGQNFSDHSLLTHAWFANTNETLLDSISTSQIDANIAVWNKTHSGPLSNAPGNILGFFRVPPTDPIFKKIPDPSTGKTSSHYELIVLDGYLSPTAPVAPAGEFISILVQLMTPTSRGSITLASSDPFAHALIDPNHLATEWDTYVFTLAMQQSVKLLAGKAWSGYVGQHLPGFNCTTAASSAGSCTDFVRANAVSGWHATSSNLMSPHGATWGVVDPDLKVKGTIGLRVVDGSVVPLPASHPQGTFYATAERAADIIKGVNWKA
ncbi:alcohol oxidase [Trametopsis cervina]|nr:alcohol oxidase [Trametopsis cervina]